MSKFVSDELKEIDLGDGDWVKVPIELSFGEVQKIVEYTEGGTEGVVKTMELLIKEWNLKDKDGNNAELNIDNIKRLDFDTISLISTALTELVGKKKAKLESKNSQKQ